MIMISRKIKAKGRLTSWPSTRLSAYRDLRNWVEINVALLLLSFSFVFVEDSGED